MLVAVSFGLVVHAPAHQVLYGPRSPNYQKD
jgi:hypothetical protein